MQFQSGSSGSGGASISTATPIVDGTATAGVATDASAGDHVHPTDTSRAATAGPTFTGVVTLPTGTVATTQSAADSTTKLATTAFATTADNLKANLAGPTFTGVVTLPTGTVATTQSASDGSTKLATTAYADTADALRPLKSTLSAKGSVYAASAASTPAELAVGTHLTQRMVADTAAATGLKWIPHVIGLGSDGTSITSSTTGTTLTDTALTMAIGASEIWVYQIMMFYTAANVTMDVKVGFTVPVSATGAWGTVGSATFNGFAPIGTGSTQLQLKALSASDSWGSPANGEGGVYIGARVVNSTNAGNVTFQMAQNTSDAGALTLKAGSSMIGWRVA